MGNRNIRKGGVSRHAPPDSEGRWAWVAWQYRRAAPTSRFEPTIDELETQLKEKCWLQLTAKQYRRNLQCKELYGSWNTLKSALKESAPPSVNPFRQEFYRENERKTKRSCRGSQCVKKRVVGSKGLHRRTEDCFQKLRKIDSRRKISEDVSATETNISKELCEVDWVDGGDYDIPLDESEWEDVEAEVEQVQRPKLLPRLQDALTEQEEFDFVLL